MSYLKAMPQAAEFIANKAKNNYYFFVEELRKFTAEYLKSLQERTKNSRVYKPYQLTGLQIAAILEDSSHKSLYMRLAKKYDNQKLIETAKRVAEKKDIKNKGAYFMKVWFKK